MSLIKLLDKQALVSQDPMNPQQNSDVAHNLSVSII